MIQWYPGHMAKAKREISEVLKLADIVYLVIDARVPKSSINPDLLELILDKPVLYIYNKSSLADLKRLKEIIKEDNIKNYLIVDAIKKTKIKDIPTKTNVILKDYIDKQTSKGYKNVMVRALVLGVPNVGKSSLINALANKRAASTNKLPGHTRNLKWINITNQVYLLDSPGVLWPKFEDEVTAYNLALTGAIKEEILPKEKLASYGFNLLNEKYPNIIKDYYKIETEDVNEFFIELGNSRGFLLENKEVNISLTYTQFLNDLKNGILGVICLD